jgi:parvulin-like peptidyl-prolyl isomerase
MNMKKILALLLALMLTLSAAAFAEAGTSAEEPIEHNYEVITDPIIITYGDRVVRVSDAMSRFMDYYQTLSGYSSYGIDPNGFISQIKESILAEMTQELIEEVKIAELGYDQFTEEEQAEIDSQVNSTYSEIYTHYYDYFTYNSAPGTDIDAQVQEVLEYYNYTREDLQKQLSNSFAANKMAEDLTKDVVLSEEDLHSYYESLVLEDQEKYNLDYNAYDEARVYGTDSRITWNPEGYRRVLQVLIGFESEDLKNEYAELSTMRYVLMGTIAPEEGYVPTMTLEEVKARMAEITAPMMVTAESVTAEFNNGVSIEELMTKYSADPNTPEEGYYVNAQSALYDPAFVDAAFSINEIGQLSAPYAGEHGLYMVYYLDDVPAGTVDIEVYRAELEEECLSLLKRNIYFQKLSEWKAEMGIETNIEMFITGYET